MPPALPHVHVSSANCSHQAPYSFCPHVHRCAPNLRFPTTASSRLTAPRISSAPGRISPRP
eukprot:6853074-Prymnesium_polylepis.1